MRNGRDAFTTDFTCRALTRGPLHHFFGYYDKCPYDAAGGYVLALQTKSMDRPPTAADEATIGIVDLQGDGQFHQIAETNAWNWQQGAQLQWLPGATENTIIYNVRGEDGFGACIHNVFSGDVRTLPRPVYAISHDGKRALTLNFSRLQDTRPGYGYAGLPDPWADDMCPDDDGIYTMDLATGMSSLLIPLAEIAGSAEGDPGARRKHWVNHLMFSNDDARFVFLHRAKSVGAGRGGLMRAMGRRMWSKLRHVLGNQAWLRSFLANRPGLKQRLAGQAHGTRMLTANSDGSDIYLLNADGMTSHFDWRNGRQLLAWARRYDVGDRYFLFTDRTDKVEAIGENVLDSDGHCSFSPDGRYVLTDTYPQGTGNMQTLLLYHLVSGERIDLGHFHSPPELQGEIRCDLHPRWNRAGTKVCFDSAHSGSRQIYELDVSDIVG